MGVRIWRGCRGKLMGGRGGHIVKQELVDGTPSDTMGELETMSPSVMTEEQLLAAQIQAAQAQQQVLVATAGKCV